MKYIIFFQFTFNAATSSFFLFLGLFLKPDNGMMILIRHFLIFDPFWNIIWPLYLPAIIILRCRRIIRCWRLMNWGFIYIIGRFNNSFLIITSLNLRLLRLNKISFTLIIPTPRFLHFFFIIIIQFLKIF